MRDAIKFESTGKTKQGKRTGTFRVKDKNKKNTTEKLQFSSYDPRAYNPKTGKNGMHVIFKETKL